jgi:sulfur-carrier protein adenylyltransferase/sulfurtransferase
MLSSDELHRYSRHVLLPDVGQKGQERLKAARILIVGLGGLGSPAALYLAAAGIGTLGVIDDDQVSLSNLQRQVLYSTEQAGLEKVDAASKRLTALNPYLKLATHSEKLTRANALKLTRDYDLVLDGTDNFESRYVLARACVENKIPHLYAGIFRFEGQLALFEPGGPCYACLYPTAPQAEDVPNCSQAGVLGPLAGVLGTLQALEALKYFLDLRESKNELFVFDGLGLRSQTLKLSKRAGCPICEMADRAFWSSESAKSAEIKSLREFPAGAVALDVRNEDEVRDLPLPSHVSNSVHIPLPELGRRLGDLSREATYVTVCRSGQRSLRAQTLLLEAGFANVLNLRSGLSG